MASAQVNDGGIHVLANAHISTDAPTTPFTETVIAVDPREPNRLIAGGIEGTPLGGRSVVYASSDGGRTWVRSRGPGGGLVDSTGPGDPAVYFGPDGTAFFARLAYPTMRSTAGNVLISRSFDGGRTWGPPVVLRGGDREWMAFDSTRIAAAGTIYVTRTSGAALRTGRIGGAVMVSTSVDSGRTFTPGHIISHDDLEPSKDLQFEDGMLGNPVTTSGGLLLIPAVVSDSLALGPRDGSVTKYRLRLLVSDDGGRSFELRRDGPWQYIWNNHAARSGVPSTAIDVTHGPYQDRVYVTYLDLVDGHLVVQVARTSDLGRTWATTVVTDSPESVPSIPTVAVNRDGVLAVTWYDSRGEKGDCWRLYAAISTDGGRSFHRNVSLSTTSTCSNTPGNWQLTTESFFDDLTNPHDPLPRVFVYPVIPARYPTAGDTQGLTSDLNGIFHIAWINGPHGVTQMWYTRFAVDSAVLARVRSRQTAKSSAVLRPLPPRGRTDVSADLYLKFSDPSIDFGTHTVSITLRIENPTPEPVNGPLEIVLEKLGPKGDRAMGLRDVRVANADRGGHGIGATWVINVGSDGVLPPGGTTPGYVLRFSFAGGVPARPDLSFFPAFRVYAHAPPR